MLGRVRHMDGDLPRRRELPRNQCALSREGQGPLGWEEASVLENGQARGYSRETRSQQPGPRSHRKGHAGHRGELGRWGPEWSGPGL